MDYGALAEVKRHAGWGDFRARLGAPARLVLFTTKGSAPFQKFAFSPADILLFGRESAGAPDEIHDQADARLFIPLASGARSLNVVAAAAMALGEALRQTGGFPTGAGNG
jgi:tRNA (cytidine/uridine-2'-O-)-methyltransferase